METPLPDLSAPAQNPAYVSRPIPAVPESSPYPAGGRRLPEDAELHPGLCLENTVGHPGSLAFPHFRDRSPLLPATRESRDRGVSHRDMPSPSGGGPQDLPACLLLIGKNKARRTMTGRRLRKYF